MAVETDRQIDKKNAGSTDNRYDRWLKEAASFEKKWRKRNNENYNFYDGEQWTPEEEQTIEERGQQAAVLNVIRPTIDMILALEHQQRADLQVIGRDVEDDAMAGLLTDLLKQTYQFNDFDYYLNRVFGNAGIGGRGAVQVDVEKIDGQKQVTVNQLPWEDVFVDPYSKKPDGSDARYIMKRIWMDRDFAKQKWPAKADEIEQITQDYLEDDEYKGQEYEADLTAPDRGNLYYDHNSDRIAVYECWYKDSDKKVHFVTFFETIFLVGEPGGENPSPFKHNQYPIILCFAFRNKKGEPKGLVEYLIKMQITLNKLNSKYLWNMSANRLIIEDDAADDLSLLRQEWSRPDGMPVLNSGGLNKIKLEENLRESSYLAQHMQFILQMIQRVSGVNDSLLGFGGVNERSAQQQQGRMIQGATLQTQLLENLRFTKRHVAKVVLLTIGETYTDERVVRIANPDGTGSYIALNQPGVDIEGNKTILNNIKDILRYDVVLSPVAPFDTSRQLMMQVFSEVAKGGVFPPEWTAQILLQLSNMPNKADLLNQLRQYLNPSVNPAVAGNQEGASGLPPQENIAPQV